MEGYIDTEFGYPKGVVKNDKKTIRAWALFDWANSAYALVISTAIFPVYFVNVTPEVVSPLGIDMYNSTLYTLSITLSYIVIAALSPLLSGIADYSGKRMYFLKLFTILGSISCLSLFFFSGASTMYVGTIAFMLATIGFSGSLVFYDSYLPIIATEDKYDSISAKGFSYGYVGSVLLLIVILFLIQKPEVFGITNPTLPSRIGFALVGVWWLGWSQYTFMHLPKDNRTGISGGSLVKGYQEVRNAFRDAKKIPSLFRFLIAFFLYMAGVQTVIYVATIFADKQLEMETAELIMIVLVIQIVGIIGATLFAKMSERIGNKKAILIQIIIWIIICIGAYLTKDKTTFYVLAAMVGMVMGGIQALSRATYSKLIPEDEDDVTSFFSFYDVVYKVAIVAGTFLFGAVEFITGDMRNSILVLGLLFVSSFFVLRGVRIQPEFEKQ